MEQLCRLLFHLARGGLCQHPFHHSKLGECTHYTVVKGLVPMLHNINKYQYSGACVVYQKMSVQALWLVLCSTHNRSKESGHPDHGLYLPAKPKDIAIAIANITWEHLECVLHNGSTLGVLLECAHAEISTNKHNKKSKTFPFFTSLLDGIIGGSLAQAVLIWSQGGFMDMAVRVLNVHTPRPIISKLLLAMQVVSRMEPKGIEINTYRASVSCLQPSADSMKAIHSLQNSLRKIAADALCGYIKEVGKNKSLNIGFFKGLMQSIAAIYTPYHQYPPSYSKLSTIEAKVADCTRGIEVLLGSFVGMLTSVGFGASGGERSSVALLEGMHILTQVRRPPAFSKTDLMRQRWQLLPVPYLMPRVCSDSLLALYLRLIPVLTDGFIAALPSTVMKPDIASTWVTDIDHAEASAKFFNMLWNVAAEHGEESKQAFVTVCEVNDVAQKIIAVLLASKLKPFSAFKYGMFNVRQGLKIRHYVIKGHNNSETKGDVFYISDVDEVNRLHGLTRRFELHDISFGNMMCRVEMHEHGRTLQMHVIMHDEAVQDTPTNFKLYSR
jgi:hypothetical protein